MTSKKELGNVLSQAKSDAIGFEREVEHEQGFLDRMPEQDYGEDRVRGILERHIDQLTALMNRVSELDK